MTNAGVIACYAPFILAFIGMIVYIVKSKRLGRYNGYLLFLLGSLLAWLCCISLFYASGTEALAAFLYDVDLPFVALSSLAVFLLVMKFYHCDDYLSRDVVFCLLAVPVITLVLAFTSTGHEFLCTSLDIVALTPLHIVTRERGIWFWVHVAYCYLFAIVATVVALVQHFRLPKLFRLPSYLLLFAMVLTLAGNVVVLTGAAPVPLDFSLLGACCCAVILFYVCIRNRGIDFLNLARSNIFNSLRESILILDDDNTVIGRNRMAAAWLENIGADAGETSFDRLLERQTASAEKIEKNAIEDGGTDYLVPVPEGKRIFNLREKDITDRKGKLIGRFVICSDVTENRARIRRMEDEVGIDALTGLNNRRRMDEWLREIDAPWNLPVSVIMGDLNYLKVTNDTMGHQQGDVLLRAAAEILVASCPPSAHLGRIGGDEFLILLPSYTGEQTAKLIGLIETRLFKAEEQYPFRVSMALGAAVKDAPELSLATVIEWADGAMYEKKRQQKADRS